MKQAGKLCILFGILFMLLQFRSMLRTSFMGSEMTSIPDGVNETWFWLGFYSVGIFGLVLLILGIFLIVIKIYLDSQNTQK